jgi:tellurite resistance protein
MSQPPAVPTAGSPAAAGGGHAGAPLEHLMPGWFATVLGWSGLALAWHRAEPVAGGLAATLALACGALAAAAFAVLLLATAARALRFPAATRADLAHPIRRGFVAAIPIGLMLLVTFAVAAFGPAHPALAPLWWLASLAQFALTVWILGRWLLPPTSPATGLAWPAVTPVLFIPVVGNVLAPLAGVPLGAPVWSLAQFAVGLLFWPIVLVLLMARLGQAGPLPERLAPSWFITVAPPAVIGLGAGVLGAPVALAWMAWGVSVFFLLWALALAPRVARLPFAVPHWAMSFPAAAFCALSLRLATAPGGGWLAWPAMALLALATLLIAALSVATLAGLARGTLLVPEPAPAPRGPSAAAPSGAAAATPAGTPAR